MLPIGEARTVLEGHIIPVFPFSHVDRDEKVRFFYEALLFAVGSRNTSFARVLSFMESLREEDGTTDVGKISDPSFIASRMNGHGLPLGGNHFEDALEFVNREGIKKVVYDFLSRPEEYREEFVNAVNGVGYKTASLWHICLGGRDLMALDLHNLRQIGGLNLPEIQLPEGVLNPKPRVGGKMQGRRIAQALTHKQYADVEKRAKGYFQRFKGLFDFPHVPLEGGDSFDFFSAAMLTAVLYWNGVKSSRGLNLFQENYLGVSLGFEPPYSRVRGGV